MDAGGWIRNGSFEVGIMTHSKKPGEGSGRQEKWKSLGGLSVAPVAKKVTIKELIMELAIREPAAPTAVHIVAPASSLVVMSASPRGEGSSGSRSSGSSGSGCDFVVHPWRDAASFPMLGRGGRAVARVHRSVSTRDVEGLKGRNIMHNMISGMACMTEVAMRLAQFINLLNLSRTVVLVISIVRSYILIY